MLLVIRNAIIKELKLQQQIKQLKLQQQMFTVGTRNIRTLSGVRIGIRSGEMVMEQVHKLWLIEEES